MSDGSGQGVVGANLTFADATLSQEVSYCVRIRLGVLPEDSNYSLEAEDLASDAYSPYDESKDILHESSINLRLCIEENIAHNGLSINDKCTFYRHYGLMDQVDVFLPLRLEVVKMEGDARSDFMEEEVNVVFEVIDPAENLSIIKGPKGKGRTGKDFIRNLVYKQEGDDNCIRDFAPRPIRNRCRQSSSDVVNAKDILFDRRKNSFETASSDPKSVVASIQETEVEEGKKIGVLNFFFHPPPIAGDNYKIRVKLISSSGAEVLLRDKPDSAFYPLYFQTPTITIWKKVKVEMVAIQEGLDYSMLGWSKIKRAYRDAYIEIEEAADDRRYIITRDEWMSYLGRVVYDEWRSHEWEEYIKQSYHQYHIDDFKKYSFPQDHTFDTPSVPNSDRLTPPDDDPDHPNNTTWEFLGRIARAVIRDKLGNSNYRRLGQPKNGFRLGICVLFCKPPFDGSTVGGSYIWDKMFYMVSSGDVANTFVHEMGHALFLDHGATAFNTEADFPFTTRTEESGSSGPFWDNHDSQDMITCIMSYEVDSPVEWHFCGLCLLVLRLYDRHHMLSGPNDTLRKVLYPGSADLCWTETVKNKVVEPDGFEYETFFLKIYRGNPGPMSIGKSLRLLALYPPEGVENNLHQDFWKDLSRFPRGRWVSSNPSVATVSVSKMGDFWVAQVRALRKGTTNIYHEIRRSTGWSGDVDRSLPMVITVV
ncbi:MAG: hypothetical protein QXJ17_05590 [Nitrososphaeria archaeon]